MDWMQPAIATFSFSYLKNEARMKPINQSSKTNHQFSQREQSKTELVGLDDWLASLLHSVFG